MNAHPTESAAMQMPITTTVERDTGSCLHLEPKWVRIHDAVRVSGMGRSLLYQRIKEGHIRSACLRDRNKTRGIRLVNVESLNRYIESFAK